MSLDGKTLTYEQLLAVLDKFYNHADEENNALSKYVLVIHSRYMFSLCAHVLDDVKQSD